MSNDNTVNFSEEIGKHQQMLICYIGTIDDE